MFEETLAAQAALASVLVGKTAVHVTRHPAVESRPLLKYIRDTNTTAFTQAPWSGHRGCRPCCSSARIRLLLTQGSSGSHERSDQALESRTSERKLMLYETVCNYPASELRAAKTVEVVQTVRARSSD